METIEINNELSEYKDCFIGTFPCDNIPIVSHRPASFIVNIDPSNKPGIHWVSIWLKKNKTGEFFDPFGYPPLQFEIANYLESQCPNGWCYNTIMLQDIFSITCGKYCILFVKLRCHNIKFIDFIGLFSTVTKINEKILEKIYKSL